MTTWGAVIDRQVIRRNAVELQSTEPAFDAHRVTQSQLLRAQQRLQALRDENAKLDEKCKSLAQHVRTLELAAAGVVSRTGREAELEAEVARLQKRVEEKTTQERDYYMTVLETKRLEGEKTSLLEEVTQLKKRQAEHENVLKMMKNDYAALKQENDVVRPKLGAVIDERDRCVKDLLAAKERIALMQETILEYEDQLNRIRKERRTNRDGAMAPSDESTQGLSTKASITNQQDVHSSSERPLLTTVAYTINNAHGDRPLYSACIADGGKTLISGGGDRTIRCWELSSGKALKTYTITDVPLSMDSTSHYLLAGCSDGIARFWDLNNFRTVELTGHHEKVVAASLSQSARNAFTASSDRTIKLWDVRSSTTQRTIMCQSSCNDLCVSGTLIISAHYNGSVWIWDDRAGGCGTEVKRVHQQGVTCVRLDSSGHRCVSLGRDGTICVRDVREMSRELICVRNKDICPSTNFARLALSLDGDLCAVGNARGEVLFASLETGHVLEHRLVGGHQQAVHSVVWTPCDWTPLLASIGEDKRVVVWK